MCFIFVSVDKAGSYRLSWCRCAVHWYKFPWISGNYCCPPSYFWYFLLHFGPFLNNNVEYIMCYAIDFQVSEFSPSTSTAMGLPREFHEQCRMTLELDHLKVIIYKSNNIAFSLHCTLITCATAFTCVCEQLCAHTSPKIYPCYCAKMRFRLWYNNGHGDAVMWVVLLSFLWPKTWYISWTSLKRNNLYHYSANIIGFDRSEKLLRVGRYNTMWPFFCQDPCSVKYLIPPIVSHVWDK